MKHNVRRGNVRVENTPKGGAKIVYLNPGEFKEVMDVLANLKVNQKFTLDKLNVNVVESYVMEENTMKKIQYKLVLRLNKRTFPTATTSPTFHIYPTEQKIMIQGSRQAQAMGEKEFLLPFIDKVLNGKEAKVAMANKAVSEVNVESKKRKTRQTLPCKYCETPFSSISAMKRHVLSAHIVALEALQQIPPDSNTISPSSSPPPKKEKHSSNNHKELKVYHCEECTDSFRELNELIHHKNKHGKLKPIRVIKVLEEKAPEVADKDVDENLMVNDAGIEIYTKEVLEEIGHVLSPKEDRADDETPKFPEIQGTELVQFASWIQACKVAPGPSSRHQEGRVDSSEATGLQRSKVAPPAQVVAGQQPGGLGSTAPPAQAWMEQEAQRRLGVELEDAREGAAQGQPGMQEEARMEVEKPREASRQERDDRIARNRQVFEEISRNIPVNSSMFAWISVVVALTYSYEPL